MFSKRFAVLIISLFTISFLHAQVPDHFYNLKVFPKDISKDELMGAMKSFTSALGVRCNYCHVGKEGEPLSKFDFESDSKETKEKARTMMEMTRDINLKYLTALSDYSDNTIQVTCFTCHRGTNEPEPLEDLLFEKVKRDGLEEAISTYNSLYDKYYGASAYDFSDQTLTALAQKLESESMNDDAITFAKINVEKYPNSGAAYFGLAEAYEKKGDKENAILNYKKTLELSPWGKDFINKKIEELSK